jgi:hypothetical protein
MRLEYQQREHGESAKRISMGDQDRVAIGHPERTKGEAAT